MMDLIGEPTTPKGFLAEFDMPTTPKGFVVGTDELATPDGDFNAFQRHPSPGSSEPKRKLKAVSKRPFVVGIDDEPISLGRGFTDFRMLPSLSPSPPLKLQPMVKAKPKRSAEDEWFLNTLLSLTADEFRLYYKLVSEYIEQINKESRKISVLWCR